MFQKLSILRFSKQRPSPGDTAQTLIQLYKVGVLTNTCKPLAQQLVQDRCAHNDVEAFGTDLCLIGVLTTMWKLVAQPFVLDRCAHNDVDASDTAISAQRQGRQCRPPVFCERPGSQRCALIQWYGSKASPLKQMSSTCSLCSQRSRKHQTHLPLSKPASDVVSVNRPRPRRSQRFCSTRVKAFGMDWRYSVFSQHFLAAVIGAVSFPLVCQRRAELSGSA